MENEEDIQRVKNEISHLCDGPVTAFVLMSRACKLAEKGTFDSEVVANGLHAALLELGFTDPEEDF